MRRLEQMMIKAGISQVLSMFAERGLDHRLAQYQAQQSTMTYLRLENQHLAMILSGQLQRVDQGMIKAAERLSTKVYR